mgnify:FL=1
MGKVAGLLLIVVLSPLILASMVTPVPEEWLAWPSILSAAAFLLGAGGRKIGRR